jgi:archaemetzincin
MSRALTRRGMLAALALGLGACQRGSELERWAFDRSVFEAMPVPGEGDWLAEHAESGQSVEQFLAGRPNRPEPARRTIAVQPLGSLAEFKGPSLAVQQEFLLLYFGLRVVILPTLDPAGLPVRHRIRGGKPQLRADDVLHVLEERLQRDAYCCIAITNIDLYPNPSWNFVFGLANLRQRVGVFSLARYDDDFYGRPPTAGRLVAERTFKILAHEVSHMLGIEHCIAHACVMNGANNQQESDRSPLHACAVCLEKLHRTLGFSLIDRYRYLESFYARHGLDAEAAWVAARLATAPG